jgi:hypothetical protein
VRSCRPEVVEMEIPFVHRMRFLFTFQPRRLSTLLLTAKRCTTLWALNKSARSLLLPRRGPVLGWVAGSCLHSTASRLHTAPTLSFTCGCQRCYRHGDLVSPRYKRKSFLVVVVVVIIVVVVCYCRTYAPLPRLYLFFQLLMPRDYSRGRFFRGSYRGGGRISPGDSRAPLNPPTTPAFPSREEEGAKMTAEPMTADPDAVTTSSLQALQSADERRLLDVVDKLRRTGLNGTIKLPQLVVCGDQSSGKSSVLEAVSYVPR